MVELESDILPQDVRDGLAAAPPRRVRRPVRGIRVRVGDIWYPIRAMDETGFDLDVEFAPKLRGLVEIHDGGTLLRVGLVVAAEPSRNVMHYDFKRTTEMRAAPPRDYVRAEPWDAGEAR
ncbi:hypothetical protein [Jannaschia formosa]|uniref:hypothetical protein n=1 Tax=Jannaschia formosa TaxID=2259592 RepID=UPI000E1BBE72|nr:hypothetical protein [Jannaschia formosa]TFL20093.1 hypothetical protein DR046_01740 [Jannaschia formosa]